MHSFAGLLILIGLLGTILSFQCHAQTQIGLTPLSQGTLVDIERRKLISVGVLGDDPPWGFRDSNGELTGIEVALAKDIAKRLNVDLALVEVNPSNRLQLLRDKRIDLLISSLSDTEERRRRVHMILPHYASAGAQLLTLKDSKLTDWEQIRHQNICAISGFAYNDVIEAHYQPRLLNYTLTSEALTALQEKVCIAFLGESVNIHYLLTQLPNKSAFKSPVAPMMKTPWALAIALDDAQTEFARFLSYTAGQWHRSGLLLQLNEQAGLPASDFIKQQFTKWNETDPNGRYLCDWDEQHRLPEDCE